ncbi:retropepsin-like aspartic protease family protein [Thermocoleostomius sinensis]|uniref:Retropepsin-like aspartic protease n=1 Tax=Thermocoleostomius sinensis A174 TaxID=2016057 RepID=A0A9E8ZFS1_9CYAN|nr:retropepsin-like aspartic protease [Thermocoleostomius sinensis]WAL60548.1 retropepsin-like aspartic protease [Thermocoleostomius sinensis A174]
MPKPFYHLFLAILASLVAGAMGGCSDSATRLTLEKLEIENLATESAPTSLQEVLTTAPVPSSTQAAPATAQLSVPDDAYQRAIDRASRAFALSRSAQSQDDWRLVASRWQQAIDLMVSVPNSSPNHANAQRKILEYRQNATYAQKQANHSIGDSVVDTTVVIHTQPEPEPPQSQPVMPMRSTEPIMPASVGNVSGSPTANPAVFYAPIVRREGNTPVIQVTFNEQQTFDMIVDTGASGTLITNQMAQALNVVPVAAAMVDTASQRGVTVPLGYVSSIRVNGAIANNVLVAIAGPQLSTGLLGHDFFGNYDVTIRETEVEFRER